MSHKSECARDLVPFGPAKTREGGGGFDHDPSRTHLDVSNVVTSETCARPVSKKPGSMPRVAADHGQERQSDHQPKTMTCGSLELRPLDCSSAAARGGCRERLDGPVEAPVCSGRPRSPVNVLHSDDEALDPCALMDPLFNVATVYMKEEVEERAVAGGVKSDTISGVDKASTSSALLSAGVGGISSLLRPGEPHNVAPDDRGPKINADLNSPMGATQLLLLAEDSFSSHVGKKFFKEGILQWSEDVNIFDMMKRISEAKNSESKILQCPKCCSTFGRKRCLERHMMAKHSDIRPHRCSLCEYSSAFKNCLKKHVLVKHSGMEPYPCTHCEYSTRYRKDLDRHIMVRHSSFRPFQCPLCDFACADVSNLKRHTRVKHFGVSPYHCTQCEYSSADKSNLRRHIRAKHSDDKPFQCSLCECAYSRKDKLKYHFRTKHSGL